MKFIRLGDCVINVSQIQLLKRVGSGCKVYMIDGSEYCISDVYEEEFINAAAYICCGGADDAQTNKR